ncbi:MAG: hypothetical protein ACI85O_001096, partial [Saprospiraceae bacterium]
MIEKNSKRKTQNLNNHLSFYFSLSRVTGFVRESIFLTANIQNEL